MRVVWVLTPYKSHVGVDFPEKQPASILRVNAVVHMDGRVIGASPDLMASAVTIEVVPSSEISLSK